MNDDKLQELLQNNNEIDTLKYTINTKEELLEEGKKLKSTIADFRHLSELANIAADYNGDVKPSANLEDAKEIPYDKVKNEYFEPKLIDYDCAELDADKTCLTVHDINANTFKYKELTDGLKNNTLTDEQLEEVIQTLSNGVSDDAKTLREYAKEVKGNIEEPRDIPYNVLSKNMISEEVMVDTNPIDGSSNILIKADEQQSTTNKVSDAALTDLDKEFDSIKLSKDLIKSLKDYNLNEKDASKLFDVITRYRNKEKFNIFNELPGSVKNMVMYLCDNSHDPLIIRKTTKDLLDNFIRSMIMDQEVINLEAAIKKEMGASNIANMYDEYLRETMEKNMIEKAEKMELENPDNQEVLDKAKTLREVSAAFTDSYTLRRLFESINNDPSIINRKDANRFKRYCEEFDDKYRESKFNIHSIRLIIPLLKRKLPNETITEDDIKRFAVLICKTTKGLNNENIVNHTYMYYLIKNILSLEYSDNESKFSKELLENITNVVLKIKSSIVEIRYVEKTDTK